MQEEIKCPYCYSFQIVENKKYETKSYGIRKLDKCENCGALFSQTHSTFLFFIKKPIYLITFVLNALTDGMGINACCRTFKISKNTIYSWLKKFAEIKKVLFLNALCHKYIDMLIEGDELYTKINKNVPQSDSLGWTIVLLERRSRFLWYMKCGKKDKQLFKNAMRILYEIIKQTKDLKLFTDGERRYSNYLFEICYELIYTGHRPKKTFKKGVKVRVKNKGSQAHKRGPKKAKYQQPKNEHPQNINDIKNSDIHANHVEAFNASLRRKCSAFRRRCNTYAKNDTHLQQRLDLQWIRHNYIEKHYTTKIIPAVFLGIVEKGFTFEKIFNLKMRA